MASVPAPSGTPSSSIFLRGGPESAAAPQAWRFGAWVSGCVLLGLGTAMVYPTLLAAVGDVAHASWRASAVGVYRLWRDLGYATGALLAGVVADALGMGWALGVVGAVTFASGVLFAVEVTDTMPAAQGPASVRENVENGLP